MSASTPRVSVVVPTKNRREVLLPTLRSILAQEADFELLVFDDGSTDNTSDAVRAEFGGDARVQLHRHESSAGPTTRRNEGARLARGEFLITIDDDCLLPSSQTFAQTLEAFNHPRAGAVTIPFCNVLHDDKRLHTVAPSPDKAEFWATFEFFGGMVAFRRDAFLKVGGYRTSYFMHVEEGDLSLRLLREGFLMRLGWAEPIHHLESPLRDSKRLHELGPRNHVLYAWYNVPMPALVPHLLLTSVGCLRHTIRIGYPLLGLRGLARGYGASLRGWRERQPVSRNLYRLSRELRRREAVPLREIAERLPSQV